ncbi:MAG: hypothetical protein GC186_07450 [Rhodobacteraceae bacterium]|nr:hypothetical protein [Paracoccaceae bacterium]
MRRRVGRIILWALYLLVASNLAAALWVWAHSPLGHLLVARTDDQIRLLTDQAVAREATPERMSALMTARLAESPRNWLVIDALKDVAAERGIAFPPPVQAQLQAADDADHGVVAGLGACGACLLDAGSCQMSWVLACQAPVVLTPLGDIEGVATESWHAANGEAVDRINLGLSIVGLGSTLLALPSEGASVPFGVGANLARLAHRTGALTRGASEMILRAVDRGVDWAGLRKLGALDLLSDPAAVRPFLHPAAFAEVEATAADLGRVAAATGPAGALYLLRSVNDADDARRLAHVSEALGPKTVGRAEVLGGRRLLRFALSLGRLGLWITGAAFWALASFATLLGHLLHHATFMGVRRLRRALR